MHSPSHPESCLTHRALKFVNSPDFETPADANHDNIYDVIVGGDHSHGATCVRSNLRTKAIAGQL